MMNITNCRYRISIKAIIFNEDWDVLLSKEKSGRRDLPGWWLERWESVFECLEREMQEEMWIKVLSVDDSPLFFLTANGFNKDRPHIANLCYKATIDSLDITASDECVAIWFFNKKTIETIDLYKASVAPIFDKLDDLM